jgi:hypothetical protein
MICALFGGNPVVSKYDIDLRHREVMTLTDLPGVSYTWHIPAAVEKEVVACTEATWNDLMGDIDRHGIAALLAAGSR